MTQTFQKIQQNLDKETLLPKVEITPELASELLGINKTNRPLRRKIVSKYARAMKDGKWRFTGDVVRISKTGNLLDTQHRMHAIVESGIPQYYNIQTGLEDDVFQVIDTGKNRTAPDVLSMLGMTSASVAATAIRTIINFDKGLFNTYNDPARSAVNERPDNVDIAQWLQLNGHDELEECMSVGSRLYTKYRFLAHSDITAFLYIFGREDVDKARQFFEHLMTGVNASPDRNSAIYFLRERLLQWQIQPRTAGTRRERYALLVKAWNYFKTGKEVKRLNWRSMDGFPKIV